MEKSVMVVGIDDSEHSYYSLNRTLEHFFSPSPENSPFKLVIVNAKPSPAATTVGFMGPVGPEPIMTVGAESMPIVNADLNKIAARVMEKAKEICTAKSESNFQLPWQKIKHYCVVCKKIRNRSDQWTWVRPIGLYNWTYRR